MRTFLLLLLVAEAAFAQDAAVGKKIFESQCALCHGQTGTGGRGPNLNRPTLSRAKDDTELHKLIQQGVPPEMPGAWQLNDREVASVAAYVRSLGALPAEKLSGDVTRGAALYESKRCASCHIVSGQGEGIGPELSNIGARRNGAYLRQALAKPADSIPEGFQYIAATTAAGQTIRGIRVNEDSFTIQLKDTQGKFHSLRKSELKQFRRLEHETPMPSFASLTASELDDLVAYLASLKGKS